MTLNNDDERRSVRAKVMLTGEIESKCHKVEARIEDLSAHGARIRAEDVPPIDTPVVFRCKNLSVEGFVAWVDGPLAGISFGEPVDPQDAYRAIEPSYQVTPQEFRRPGFQARQLTEAERQIVEQWAAAFGNHAGE